MRASDGENGVHWAGESDRGEGQERWPGRRWGGSSNGLACVVKPESATDGCQASVQGCKNYANEVSSSFMAA